MPQNYHVLDIVKILPNLKNNKRSIHRSTSKNTVKSEEQRTSFHTCSKKNINLPKNLANVNTEKIYDKNDYYFRQLFIIYIIAILIPNGLTANVRPDNGLMKLCPPGGETFTNAWQMACGMRRKRRSLPIENKNNQRLFSRQLRLFLIKFITYI